MYIPNQFAVQDRALLLDVMRENNFALLLSNQSDGEPFVTHLPFVIREQDQRVIIEGHMARANPHWQLLDKNPAALIVFNGPHCYISPALYESQESVPTWNYVAVHAYGKVRLLHEAAEKQASQQRLVANIDPGYLKQFDALRPAYLDAMLDNIVAFEFDVERLEGKFKVSQNRPVVDRRNVATALETGGEQQRGIAKWMRRIVPLE